MIGHHGSGGGIFGGVHLPTKDPRFSDEEGMS